MSELKPIFYCPECLSQGDKNKLKVFYTKEYFALGFPSIRRRKKCIACDFRINTIEMELTE
jgi:transcriptional regulator NrdR family protein